MNISLFGIDFSITIADIIIVFLGTFTITCVLCKVIPIFPFGKLYKKAKNHYTNECRFYVMPNGSLINKNIPKTAFDKSRVNTILLQYFFITLSGIIFFLISLWAIGDLLKTTSLQNMSLYGFNGGKLWELLIQWHFGTPLYIAAICYLVSRPKIEDYFVTKFLIDSPSIKVEDLKIDWILPDKNNTTYYFKLSATAVMIYFPIKFILISISTVPYSDYLDILALIFSTSFIITGRILSLIEILKPLQGQIQQQPHQ